MKQSRKLVEFHKFTSELHLQARELFSALNKDEQRETNKNETSTCIIYKCNIQFYKPWRSPIYMDLKELEGKRQGGFEDFPNSKWRMEFGRGWHGGEDAN